MLRSLTASPLLAARPIMRQSAMAAVQFQRMYATDRRMQQGKQILLRDHGVIGMSVIISISLFIKRPCPARAFT